MVDHALEALSRYIFYRTSSDPEDGSRQEDLLAKRSALLEKLEEFAVGTQSNAVEAVRRSVSSHVWLGLEGVKRTTTSDGYVD